MNMIKRNGTFLRFFTLSLQPRLAQRNRIKFFKCRLILVGLPLYKTINCKFWIYPENLSSLCTGLFFFAHHAVYTGQVNMGVKKIRGLLN